MDYSTSPWQNQHADAIAAFERTRTELQRSKRRWTIGAAVFFGLALAGSLHIGEVSLSHLYAGLPDMFTYLGQITPSLHMQSLGADMSAWYWALPKWLNLLLDTVIIAFLGTVIGTTVAIGLCFSASRNLAQNRIIFFLSRRFMEIARGVPDLVFALIFVYAFGLGPFPGVLALAVHSAGALCKLFAEINENIDMKPVEGLRASGASWTSTMRFGVLPQVLPNYLSHALLRLEINVRAASVVGFVGAGGIGQELMLVVQQFIYTDISAIVLLLIAIVSFLDITCERIRHAVIAGKDSGKSLFARTPSWVLWLAFAAVVIICLHRTGFFNLAIILQGFHKLGWLVALMLPPSTGGSLSTLINAMGQTLAMAFLGTLGASLVALPLGFLGARNTGPGRMVRFGLRRVFDVLRGVDPLIWALVVINMVGLGPFAGILAIAIGDSGVLAKIFAEAIENVEAKPIEGVRSCGASTLEVIRYGYLPQILPVLLSTSLYYFESNTRAATILGVVGAGGIGLQLTDRICVDAWNEVCFIIILILAAVYGIDALSRFIRQRVIGTRENRS